MHLTSCSPLAASAAWLFFSLSAIAVTPEFNLKRRLKYITWNSSGSMILYIKLSEVRSASTADSKAVFWQEWVCLRSGQLSKVHLPYHAIIAIALCHWCGQGWYSPPLLTSPSALLTAKCHVVAPSWLGNMSQEACDYKFYYKIVSLINSLERSSWETPAHVCQEGCYHWQKQEYYTKQHKISLIWPFSVVLFWNELRRRFSSAETTFDIYGPTGISATNWWVTYSGKVVSQWKAAFL